MANTITNLVPTLYEALDVVSREMTGFIPAVTLDAQASMAAKDQTIRVPIAPASTAADITPATAAPDTGDQTIGNATITISKARAVPIRWTGEEWGSLSGNTKNQMLRNQFAQAMRTLVNEIEADLADLYKKSSRAYGTAGTTPFASTLSEIPQVLKILKDNGAPQNDLQLIMNTAAGANLRALGQLSKANEAGSDQLLRRGVLLDMYGFMLRESAQVKLHTKGTATGYDVNNGPGYAVGDTTIVVDGSDSGTILAGDVVTWAGDTNKYIVASATASGAASGNIVLNAPGLQATLANAVEGTTGNSYTANLAFSRSAIILAARAPMVPEGGDLAVDRMTVVDPVSGIPFTIAMYKEYHRVHYEVSLAWGVSCIKPEHVATLLG